MSETDRQAGRQKEMPFVQTYRGVPESILPNHTQKNIVINPKRLISRQSNLQP